MATETADNIEQVSSDGWTTVAAESGSPIIFDSVGSQFIGEFQGIRHIVPPTATTPDDEFDQLQFRDEGGNLRTINAGYKLLEAFSSIDAGSKVRITRTPDVDMNDPKKNAMKDYRVEVAAS